MTESGLPGVLFNMLDTEMDKQLIKDIHDTLISMLQMLAVDNLTKWINLCKSVLTVSSGIIIVLDYNYYVKIFIIILHAIFVELNNKEIDKTDGAIINDEDETGDDHDEFQKDSKNELLKRKRQPRWPTRVFAVQCICRIISTCHKECDSTPHFNLSLAKELSFTNNKGMEENLNYIFLYKL